MTRKKEHAILDQLGDQIAEDAETLKLMLEARIATGHPITPGELAMFQRMRGNIANRVIFDLASIRYRVTIDSEKNADNGRLPRAKLLTRSQLRDAAKAYAASGGTTERGWKEGIDGKGGMLEHLRVLYPQHHKIKRWVQVARRLENAGITEGEIRDIIANWKPEKSR